MIFKEIIKAQTTKFNTVYKKKLDLLVKTY